MTGPSGVIPGLSHLLLLSCRIQSYSSEKKYLFSFYSHFYSTIEMELYFFKCQSEDFCLKFSHDHLPSDLIAQSVRVLVIYSRGHGFKSHRGQRFFFDLGKPNFLHRASKPGEMSYRSPHFGTWKNIINSIAIALHRCYAAHTVSIQQCRLVMGVWHPALQKIRISMQWTTIWKWRAC